MESKGIRETEGIMDSKSVAIPSVRGWGVSASFILIIIQKLTMKSIGKIKLHTSIA